MWDSFFLNLNLGMIVARKNSSCILYWKLEDVKLGKDIVFEEEINWETRYFCGLEKFVEIDGKIAVFDNHNYALYFWYDAYEKGTIETGLPVLHIDQHSDLHENENIIKDSADIWKFVEQKCEVGNFLQPAKDFGLIWNIEQVRTEFSLLNYDFITLTESFILDIDIDFWDPRMSIEQYDQTIKIVRQLIQQASFVTIATSPFFIDQKLALKVVGDLLVAL